MKKNGAISSGLVTRRLYLKKKGHLTAISSALHKLAHMHFCVFLANIGLASFVWLWRTDCSNDRASTYFILSDDFKQEHSGLRYIVPIKIKEDSVELSLELMQHLLKTFQGHK